MPVRPVLVPLVLGLCAVGLARSHVHVQHTSGEAKFWLEPGVELAADYGLGRTRINAARKIIEEHRDEIRAAWARHFGS